MDLAAFMAADRGPSLLATSWTMIVLSTIFVGLRYFARYHTNQPFSVPDVIVPFAWLAEIGLCINGLLMVRDASTGRHQAFIVTIGPDRITEHFKGIMVMELLHPAAVAFPKLIVVLLYLQILTTKYERIAAKAVVVLVSATWLAFTVAAIFQCTPFEFNWNKTVGNGRCFNIEAYWNSSSIPNIFTDLAVIMLPLRTVWALKISTGRRMGLLLIFMIGSVGIIASIIRTAIFAKTLAEAGPLVDSTYNHVALVNWTTIEPGIYLLSACALSFKPLFSMCSKALHLHAFTSNTKSTLKPSKSHWVKKSTSQTQADIHLQQLHDSSQGRFHRLSEDSEDSVGEDKKMEVLVTTTVDVNTGPDAMGGGQVMHSHMRGSIRGGQ
ncbi:hypothetical protein GQ44DRAFT_772951 [Phaeosphaeriaceae sp. PMI808]|nr:hypothetical protein GQ44DRAFT_772951 [Phaeosphaeriaceae sp. PMI808]